MATGETDGYYIDYADEPLRLFGRALAEGFAYQGDAVRLPRRRAARHAVDRICRRWPSSTRCRPTTRSATAPSASASRRWPPTAGRDDALRALLACVLLAPPLPMLFMGEEYAASTPFQYFCDFDGDLAQAVTEGRRAEFGRFARFADPAVRDRIPDPNAESTFQRSKLDWAEREREPHAGWLALYTAAAAAARDAPGAVAGRRAQRPASTLPARGHAADRVAARRRPPLAPAGAARRPRRRAGEPLTRLPGEPVYRSHPAPDGAAAWSVRRRSGDRMSTRQPPHAPRRRRRSFRAPPTACSCTPTSASPTRPRWCPTWPSSASATSTARRRCARGPAAGTATTSSTTAS